MLWEWVRFIAGVVSIFLGIVIFVWMGIMVVTCLEDIHRIADALDDYVYDDEEEVDKSEIEEKE